LRALAISEPPFAFNWRTSVVDRRGPPLVDPGSLGLRDALKLPFAPQVGLELGQHPEHVEEAFARRRAGVDGLLSLRAA
jgi:hypothetical protein